MSRRSFLVGVVLLVGAPASAQEPEYREDLRFAEALRARGDHGLALEWLKRLEKGAPPQLARELPLEYAKVRRDLARDEPDSGKRLALYRQARQDFEQFIRTNPGHERVPEANLEIARVLNLQGKTELSRATLQEDPKAKRAGGAQARATLEEAGKRLEAAASGLEAQRGKLPDPDALKDPAAKKRAQAARRRLDAEVARTRLDRALNWFDQAETYFDAASEVASQLAVKAAKAIKPLAAGPAGDPITWKAQAWLGRIALDIETPDKARAQLTKVLLARDPAAEEGQRLARYFRMLVVKKSPTDEEKKKLRPALIESARRWRADYPRFRKTPEGFGVTFLLAETLLDHADKSKLPRFEADRFRTEARALLREVEESENEYTDEARRLKIYAINKQGGFTRPVRDLRTFEECYVRAQYEALQLAKDAKSARSEKELEAKRKARVATILSALNRGLGMKDAKRRESALEANNARAMLAFYSLLAGKLEDAIKSGESFAREDPRSGQAAMAAVYALQAYAQLVAKKKADFEDVTADRDAMLDLARYVEERWPSDLAGDTARHAVGRLLMQEENYPEAIKRLSGVSASYPSVAFARHQLAECAFKAEGGRLEPIPGDRPGDYRKRALLALENIPESVLGADPATNHVYAVSKAQLGRELFRPKRFKEMESLAEGLLKRLPALKFSDDPEKDRAIHDQLRFELVDVRLYAKYGLADQAFGRGEHQAVAALLDPVVDRLAGGGEAQEKVNLQKNAQLGMAILSMALRSNVQLGKLDRTQAVLDALKVVQPEGSEEGATGILKQLMGLIRTQVDELKRKGDRKGLAQTVKGFTEILDRQVKAQKKLTPEFLRLLADCYAQMDQHDKAARRFEEALALLKDAKPGTEEDRMRRGVQVLLVREYRQTKDEDDLKKATAVMDEVMGTEKRPGWGRRNLDALKESGKLLEARRKYAEAFKTVWSPLVKQLARRAQDNRVMKEHYLECYFHMILSYYKYGQSLPSPAKRKEYARGAARRIAELDRNWEDFGSEASKRRFEELFSQESELKREYEALKKK
jgi:hypothetical protein